MTKQTEEKSEQTLKAEQKKELKMLRSELKKLKDKQKFNTEDFLSAEQIVEIDSINVRIRELMDVLTRDKKITILVTRSERERLKRLAAAADKTLNYFLITSSFRKRPPMDADSAKVLTDLRLELRKIGTNLNQLAAATNAARRGNSEPPSAEQLSETIKEVQTLIEKINRTV
jgi:uncharacterized protein YqgQ